MEEFGSGLLSGISKQIDIVVGLVYALNTEEKVFKPVADYAYISDEKPKEFGFGMVLPGRLLKIKKQCLLANCLKVILK